MATVTGDYPPAMSEEADFPKYADFHWPTLVAVRNAGGSATNEEIEEAVTAAMGFNEAAQSELHDEGPQTELAVRIGWARSWLKGMGLLENSARAVWTTTTEGRTATEDDLPALRAEYSRRLREASKSRRQTEDDEELGGEIVPEEESQEWQATLLDELLKMEPDAFERLAQRLLREAGFVNTQVTGRSGDGGIDGTGDYQISLLTFPVYFQCKRYKGTVGSEKVRDFRGAMAGRGDKGMIITTGTFTSSAKEEATRDGAPPIDLIDGERLCNLLRDHEIGVEVKERVVKDVTVIPDFFSTL